MRFWSFFWKKKKRSTTQQQQPHVVQENMSQPAKGAVDGKGDGQGEKPSRTDSKRRRTEKLTGLTEFAATPSAAKETGTGSRQIPADSISQVEMELKVTTSSESRGHQYKSKSTSTPRDGFAITTTPTLHAKRRDDSSIPRHKSSKRKAEDQARERELRSMSSPIPIPKRAISYSDSPLRRDTQKESARLRKDGGRYFSEISLPIPEYLPDMGDGFNQNSYKVNALDVLSPRPTIRYNRSPLSTRSRSQTNSRQSARTPIPEEEYSSQKRIDNLADSLDAGGLRELLERDQRRRERKRKNDQARLDQKLKRRAEYEKEQEKEREHQYPHRPETEGGHDSAGLAVSSSQVTPRARPDAGSTSVDPFFDDNTAELKVPALPSLGPGSSIYTRNSQASFSPPTSPTQRPIDRATLSQPYGPARVVTPDLSDTAELGRTASVQSNVQPTLWTSFFRRGAHRGDGNSVGRRRQASGEFSNTSRDSIARAQSQQSMVGAPRTFRKSRVPQRTQSKFREDLPELPLSPPDSRVESPEVEGGSVIGSAPPEHHASATDSTRFPAPSPSRPIFDQTADDDPLGSSVTNEASTLNERQTPPSTAVLSRSLASVDSEASWLSGKPVKRSSTQRDQPLRQGLSSPQPHLAGSEAGDEGDVADDPYFSTLSPEAGERRRSSPINALRKASSTALVLDTENELEGVSQPPPKPVTGNEIWHSGAARQPNIVRQAAQARSKEGLLKEYLAADAESGAIDDELSDFESPDLDDGVMEASSSPIFRAQSVNYGTGHIRHISAGSAKLLNIRPSSVDSKRHSLPRPERSSTPMPDPSPREEEG